MSKIIGMSVLLFLGWYVNVFAETMSLEEQAELLARLEYIKNDGPRPASIDSIHHWCGTPYLADAFLRLEQMGRQQQAKARGFMARPMDLPELYVSPSDYFLIHYAVSGSQAVRDAGVDVMDGGDGVPDYINMLAIIADSVMHNITTVMGYPVPPQDGFGAVGDPDGRYDIFVRALSPAIYGQTTMEYIISDRTMTSYIELDNDYAVGEYADRPFDAIRVTMAHEFFHAVQLGMDYTEYEGGTQPNPPDGVSARVYWWEMSSVWMEEQLYDEINDYYTYIPYYYKVPWQSIQSFIGIHPYGAGIFPIFLTEKWGQVIVRDIWTLCAAQLGGNFLSAANQAILFHSNGDYDLRRAFSEFTVWNWFTGDRFYRAPDTMRFSEGMNYPKIPKEYSEGGQVYRPIVEHVAYDTLRVSRFQLPHLLQNMSANYVLMNSVGALSKELVFRTRDDFNVPWNGTRFCMSFITIPRDPRATAGVEIYLHPENASAIYTFENHEDLQSLVFIPSVTSTIPAAYPCIYNESFHYSYFILDTSLNFPSEVFPPYANLIVAVHENDRITFKARAKTSPDSLLAKEAYLEIDLFTVAGENVRHLESQPGYFEGIWADWYLDNQSGKKVAAGVYLALVKLVFTDGSESKIERVKVAVIK